MNKLLTISIAAYNVSPYIDKLMDSVVSANVLDSIEIIIVNDGSTDDTLVKAREYESKYPNSVVVIDKNNGGHGSTINSGMKAASGKYFRALDGDDWLDSNSLNDLVKRISSIDADVILSNAFKCFENGRIEKMEDFSSVEDGRVYDFDEISKSVKWMRYHTVIYKTSLLQNNNIALDEHCFYVDTEFMLYAVPFINSVYLHNACVYCYRLGLTEQSVSAESRMKHINDGYTVSKSIIAYYLTHKDEMSPSQSDYYIHGASLQCLWHFKSLMLFPSSPDMKRKIKAYDQSIFDSCPSIYHAMTKQGELSKMLKILRGSKYSLYALGKYYQEHVK